MPVPTYRDGVTRAIQGLVMDGVTQLGATAVPALTFTTLQVKTDVVNCLKRRKLVYTFGDLATAGSAVTESAIWMCDADMANGCRLVSANIILPIAVTASASVYATMTVSVRRVADYTTAIVMATQTTNTTGNGGLGTTVALTPYALTNSATAANLLMGASDVMTFLVAKASTGTALTAALSLAQLSVVIEEL
jgi:hypothetical protein